MKFLSLLVKKNKLLKRVVVGVMAVAMVFGLVVTPATTVQAAPNMKGQLVVIHTNDIHGYYEKSKDSLGISSVRALKGYYQNLGARVLVLDAGDFSQGHNLVNYFKDSKKLLETSQKEWEEYEKAQSKLYVTALDKQGTMYQNFVVGFQTELYKQRAMELERLYEVVILK